MQDTDNFITQRGSDLYKIEVQNLMSTMQNDDLMVVGRGNDSYKVEWSVVKDELGGGGGGGIYPNTNDITISPSVSGSGTELDPYVLTPIAVTPFGTFGQTLETITIDSQSPDTPVRWDVTDGVAGERFNQPEGITDANGDWSGKLQYSDDPETTIEGTVYTGLFRIGIVHFSWAVTQSNVTTSPTSVTSVSLVESDPEGDRFTSQSFVASSQVVDGVPISTKTIDAHVDGTISRKVKFDEPLESSATVPTNVGYLDAYDSFSPGHPESACFDGNLDTYAEVNNTDGSTANTLDWYPAGNIAPVGSLVQIKSNSTTGFNCTPQQNFNAITSPFVGYEALIVGDSQNAPELSFVRTSTSYGTPNQWNAIFVDGVMLENASVGLTFANGTNMEALAAGDTVNQTTNFTEPLESSGTVPGPIYSDDVTDIAGSGFAQPVTNGFDNDLSTYFQSNSNTSSQTELWRFYLTPYLCDQLNQASAFTFYQVPNNGTSASGSTSVKRNNATDLWNVAASQTTPMILYGATGPITDWVVNDFISVTNQIGSQGSGRCYGISYTIDGVETFIVDGAAQPSLTFANGTDMSALGAGDAVSQTASPLSDNVSSQTVSFVPTTLYNAKYSGQYNGDATLLSWDQASVTQYGVTIQGGSPAEVNEVTVVYFQFPGTCKPTINKNGGESTGPYSNAIYYSDNGSSWTQVYSSTDRLGDYVANEAHQYWAWQNNYGGGWSTQNYKVTAAQDSQGVQKLTCASDLNLSLLNSNDLITQEGSTATGHVYNVTGSTVNLNDSVGTWGLGKLIFPATTTTGTVGSITDTTASLSSSSGSWVNGVDVTTGNKTTTGTVGSIADTTANLSSSSGTWANGLNVVGPEKTIVEENARLYCAFDSNGNVTDLQNNPQDPPYTTTDSNPGLTLTFPATFPSGQTPDEELPDGTTLTVEVTAENSTSTDSKEATVQPVSPDPTPTVPLAGLTTIWSGNENPRKIVTGMNLQSSGGMVWIKNATGGNPHNLFDTVRGPLKSLASNDNAAELDSVGTLTSFDNDGFSIAANSYVNGTSYDYVGWSFGKAAGYFDVVQYTGNDAATQSISHSLATRPGFVITKQISSPASSWACWHTGLISEQWYIYLDQSLAQGNGGGSVNWGITDSTFDANSGLGNNNSSSSYISYLFAEDTPGVIKCGGYTGVGGGTTVITGFKPQWLMVKNLNANGDWIIFDDKRGVNTGSPAESTILWANEAFGENSSDNWNVEFNDDGFVFTSNNGGTSGANAQYIYVAIAAPPDAVSMTTAQLAEAKLKFATFENRSMVKCGNDAEAARDALIQELALDGYSLTEILNYL